MATELKRMTFVVTPEIEIRLDKAKKNNFYNCNQSEMIRTLVEIGLDSIQMKDKIPKENKVNWG